MLCGLYVLLYLGRNPHSLAELPLVQSTAILSSQVWTTDWNFLMGTDPFLYFRPLLSNTTISLCALRTLQFAPVIVTQFSFHSTTWYPYICHVYKLDCFEWKQVWPALTGFTVTDEHLDQGFSNFFGPRHTIPLCEI